MPRIFPSTRSLTLCTVLAVSRELAAAPPDPYDAAVVSAHDAEQRGDYRGAARALVGVVDRYEQDYAIALELGWAFTLEGDLPTAERAYRVAVARAPASKEAKLALASTLAAEGRCDDARTELSALGDARAADAVTKACAPPQPPVVRAATSMNAMAFPGNQIKSKAVGAFADVAGTPASGWTLGASFRDLSFSTQSTAIAPWSQQEGYLHAGFQRPAAGLALHGALIHDGSGVYGTSGHAGLSARISPAGDITLDASVSVYPDRTIPRGALAWSIPVAGPLRLVPGVAAQDSAGTVLGAASATAVLAWPALAIWAGGTWGQQDRPAYLAQSVVYDIPERVVAGAWAGLRLRMTGPLWGLASYSFDHLEGQGAAAGSTSGIHAVALGLELDL